MDVFTKCHFYEGELVLLLQYYSINEFILLCATLDYYYEKKEGFICN